MQFSIPKGSWCVIITLDQPRSSRRTNLLVTNRNENPRDMKNLRYVRWWCCSDLMKTIIAGFKLRVTVTDL